MFAILQNLLYGKPITADKHVSDSKMYQKLAGKTDNGKIPVYGKVESINLSIWTNILSSP